MRKERDFLLDKLEKLETETVLNTSANYQTTTATCADDAVEENPGDGGSVSEWSENEHNRTKVHSSPASSRRRPTAAPPREAETHTHHPAPRKRSRRYSREVQKYVDEQGKPLPKEEASTICIARGKDGFTRCKSKALNGYRYCWHHAPLDPESPFIFCQYKDPNKRSSKKCYIPVPKKKQYPFCNYHIKTMVPDWRDAGGDDVSTNLNTSGTGANGPTSTVDDGVSGDDQYIKEEDGDSPPLQDEEAVSQLQQLHNTTQPTPPTRT
ncbi:hypothetical protein Pelo_14411 [Pelomyxa schiedti]|nr:hypothetical protein Pelo_14411 [Pelomyxa schiedti]